MKINEAFPSAFLKADDLQGRDAVVSIASANLEEIGQGRDKETKLVIAFHGKQKKLIANKTNATTIAKLYGDDTDGWIGQRITLCAREVEFQGEMVLALRVSLTKPGGLPLRQAAQPGLVAGQPAGYPSASPANAYTDVAPRAHAVQRSQEPAPIHDPTPVQGDDIPF